MNPNQPEEFRKCLFFLHAIFLFLKRVANRAAALNRLSQSNLPSISRSRRRQSSYHDSGEFPCDRKPCMTDVSVFFFTGYSKLDKKVFADQHPFQQNDPDLNTILNIMHHDTGRFESGSPLNDPVEVQPESTLDVPEDNDLVHFLNENDEKNRNNFLHMMGTQVNSVFDRNVDMVDERDDGDDGDDASYDESASFGSGLILDDEYSGDEDSELDYWT